MHYQVATAPNTDADAFCATGTSPTTLGHTHAHGTVGILSLPAGRPLQLGALPARCDIRYEILGTTSTTPVVVLGGISADGHVSSSTLDPSPGWWESQVGPAGAPLDTRHLSILSFDYLGASSTTPRSGALSADDSWPAVTAADQADVLACVLDHLGLPQIPLLVGASYGGIVALAFASRHPGRVKRLMVIGAAHRPHAMATAQRSLQRRIVRLGLECDRAADALGIARGLALTTYRSTDEFETRFDVSAQHGADGGYTFPVEAYLEARGRHFASCFCPDAFLRLSESIDLSRIDVGGVVAPTTLVAFDTDRLAPPWLVEETARGIGGPVAVQHLRSRTGHDGFLTEVAAISDLLRTELQRAGLVPAAVPVANDRESVR